jgi:hypothetical protein
MNSTAGTAVIDSPEMAKGITNEVTRETAKDYRMTVTPRSVGACTVAVRGQEAGAGRALGHEDGAPTEADLFAAALAACLAAYAGAESRERGLDPSRLRIDAAFTVPDTGPADLSALRVRILPHEGFGPEQREQLARCVC